MHTKFRVRKVAVDANDCWLWLGRVTGDGYGVVKLEGRNSKRVAIHRWSWAMQHGRWPHKDCVIHHMCHVKRCFNPAHLEELLHAEHSRAHATAADFSGERNPRAVLSADDVRWLDRQYATGKFTLKELAQHYGVCTSTVWAAIRRQNWKRLPSAKEMIEVAYAAIG